MKTYKRGAYGIRPEGAAFMVTKDGADLTGPMSYDTATLMVSRKYRAAKDAEGKKAMADRDLRMTVEDMEPYEAPDEPEQPDEAEAPFQAFQPAYGHDTERLDALMKMDMAALKALGQRLCVAQPDSPLWTRYGMAREVMIREDAFPYHRWEVPASRTIILSTQAPIHTDLITRSSAIGEATIGHAWFRVRDHVAALNNVASWRGEPEWTYRLIGITDGFCDDRLAKELDAVPF